MLKKFAVVVFLILVMLMVKVTCNAAEMLQTTNFKAGVSLPWHLTESDENNAYSRVLNGEYMIHITRAGINKWDVRVRHREISIVAGHMYTVHFKVRAQKSQLIYAKIGDMGEPYNEVWNNNWSNFTVGPDGIDITQTFTASKNCPNAEFSFDIGGLLCNSAPNEIYFIEMSLKDEQFVPTSAPVTPTRNICVNQLGYYPDSSKKATLKTASTTPVDWQLKDSSGRVVASGKTIVKGYDKASGDSVHIIDFSACNTPGKGYQLFAGSESSYPFDIGTDMYYYLQYDALKYFYFARSGIEIKMPYCQDARWARPAWHSKDTVTMFTGWPFSDGLYTGGPTSMDCTGGWYTSGNLVKDVPVSGMSAWLLQNEYERALESGDDYAFRDGSMNIPESENGRPDILDEARWNVEYLLKAQIPAGFDKAGMVINGIGTQYILDESVTGKSARHVYYPPSTAATLNFSAVTAQASRLWKTLDSEFSDKCLAAAETAWEAAVAHPDIIAANLSENTDLSDDFYWAACELYITTEKSIYLDYIKSSPHYCKMLSTALSEDGSAAGCFDSDNTAALGTMSLVLAAPDGIPLSDISAAKEKITKLADNFIGIQQKEGYGVPLEVSEYRNTSTQEVLEDGYPFGSNKIIMNDCIVMAYAYELSKDVKYFNGMLEAMDYIMGCNPLTKCYITGYGEKPVKYPYDYFVQDQFADLDVPPGILVSGPNSDAKNIPAGIDGIPAQKCYEDMEELWSTNDSGIEYNASLAWVAGYLYEKRPEIIPTPTVPPTPFVVEDLNGDRAINMADIMVVAAVYNTVRGDSKYIERCDLNSDNAINMSDVMMIAKKFSYTY